MKNGRYLLATLTCFVLVHTRLCGESIVQEVNLDVEGVIAAYGDFNADRTVDVFIISSDWKQLKVYVWLVAKQQFNHLTSVNLEVKPEERIESVSTADFDGDGCLDVLLSTSATGEEGVTIQVYYGDTETLKKGTWSARMVDQPAVLDANGDLLPDLFGTSLERRLRSYWISVPPSNNIAGHFVQELQFNDEVSTILTSPHANAFVDVTQDMHPDLVVKSYNNETGSVMFEVWSQSLGASNLSLVDSFELDLPSAVYVGQMAFFDYDADGVVDLLLPVCLDVQCESSLIYSRTPTNSKLSFANWTKLLDNSHSEWKFSVDKMNGKDKLPLTIISGDYVLDGFPDAVAVLEMKKGGRQFGASLINIACKSTRNNICASSRTFKVEDVTSTLAKPVSISLMDVHENGGLDMLVTHLRSEHRYMTAVVPNEYNTDTAFINVSVVYGGCYRNCKCETGTTKYGMQQVGGMVNIKTTNTDGHLMQAQGVQSSLSSYFSLQLPYVIFGLGRSPNFVEEISVGLPKGPQQVDRVRTYSGIIPNAQVIVIPYPKDSPNKWMTKLLVTPSRMFLQTGGVLLGLCLFVAAVITILHVKEKKEDEEEKRRDAHKFHFDAL